MTDDAAVLLLHEKDVYKRQAVIQGLYLLKQKEVKEIEEKRRESEQRQWNDQTRV